jgi:hypothetical protein
MIFRTQVMVVCTIPQEWSDVVGYAFGVNATDASAAIKLTVDAARDAIDRDGHYIGGVVIEAACRCAYPGEFQGSEKYFHGPMSEHGIFYVTGVTYTGLSTPLSAEVAAELAAAKERIARLGLPAPIFTHPQLRMEPPTQVRMVCSVCAHWVQVSNAGLVFSFISGLNRDSPEGKEASKAAATASPFMRRHLSKCRGPIKGIQEDDPRWSQLAEINREDENAEWL